MPGKEQRCWNALRTRSKGYEMEKMGSAFDSVRGAGRLRREPRTQGRAKIGSRRRAASVPSKGQSSRELLRGVRRKEPGEVPGKDSRRQARAVLPPMGLPGRRTRRKREI